MVGKGLIFHFTGVDSNIFSLKTKIGLDLLPYVWKQYSNLRKISRCCKCKKRKLPYFLSVLTPYLNTDFRVRLNIYIVKILS